MESEKIICHKPGPQWPGSLPEVSEGLHPSLEREFIRRVRVSEDYPFWEFFNE